MIRKGSQTERTRIVISRFVYDCVKNLRIDVYHLKPIFVLLLTAG